MESVEIGLKVLFLIIFISLFFGLLSFLVKKYSIISFDKIVIKLISLMKKINKRD